MPANRSDDRSSSNAIGLPDASIELFLFGSQRSMMAWRSGSMGAGFPGNDPGCVGLCVGCPETCSFLWGFEVSPVPSASTEKSGTTLRRRVASLEEPPASLAPKEQTLEPTKPLAETLGRREKPRAASPRQPARRPMGGLRSLRLVSRKSRLCEQVTAPKRWHKKRQPMRKQGLSVSDR